MACTTGIAALLACVGGGFASVAFVAAGACLH